MFASRILTPIMLASGVTLSTLTLGQPPSGDGQDKKGAAFEKKGSGFQPFEKKANGGPGNIQPGPGRQPRPDPAVDAWLKTLIERMNDPHDTIRDSARAAIISVGPPAIPILRQLAEGPDPAKAVAAQRLIMAIEHHHRGPGGMNVPGGHPGPGGPMGPMPGGPGDPPAGPGGFNPGPGQPRGPGMPPGGQPSGPGSNRLVNPGANPNPPSGEPPVPKKIERK